MQIHKILQNVLKSEKEYCVADHFSLKKLINATENYDQKLLSLLLNNEVLKHEFFIELDNCWVFNKKKFLEFIQLKVLTNSSFTAFKNQIGLSANAASIAQSKEVVLDFPYKDAVLQASMTKEDDENNESFLHQSLMSHEIDALLLPKVFENWKYYDTNGCQELRQLQQPTNFIFKGNNLIVLNSIHKLFANKIKLIYIDPPYNTGSDSFLYNDNFSHSTWLVFMKNRLEIAWKMLRKDGSIFIQVDDSEFAYLKVLCDEIFGRENFREAIVIKSSTESGVNAINVKRGERLFKVKEYILFYSKTSDFRFFPFYTKSNFNKNYKYEVKKIGENYTVTDLSNKFASQYADLPISPKEKDALAARKFRTYALANAENIYSLEKNIKKAGAKFKDFALKNKTKDKVEEFVNSKNEIKLIYQGGVFVPLQERIISDEKSAHFGVLASDLWVDIGTTPANEGGIKFKNGKKPEKLLQRIIAMATQEGDWVLDYHLGSGTTAAVAHKMNRKYIGIEQLDYGENDSIIRLQNVINGDKTGISKLVNWNGGGSFVSAELAINNPEFFQKIQQAKNKFDLLHVYEQLENYDFVKFTIDLNDLSKYKSEFGNLTFIEQKQLLYDMIDKNQLYINFEDMEDADYKVDAESKKLNSKFYSL